MQKYELLVQEDLNVGTDMTWITAPGGGKLRATQIGLHSVARGQKAYTATWAPGSIAAGSYAETTVTVPDAAAGDFVRASHNKMLTGDLRITGHVQAAGTVQVIIHNPTSAAITVASGTVSVLVFPFIGRSTDPEGPTASFTYTPVEGGLTGEGIVEFTDTSTNGAGTIDTWAWDFGDGVGTSSDQNPTYTFNQGGGSNPQDFTVTLTVTDDNLNTDQYQAVVSVTFNS